MKKFFIALLFLISPIFCFGEVSVTALGGAGTVSGSCFLVDTGKEKILVDCGLFMESENEDKNFSFPDEAIKADALILTHAHLDHSGKIPLLINKGFKGKIYCTDATKTLALTLYKNRNGLDLIQRKWFWSANQESKAQRYGSTVVAHWTQDCKESVREISTHETKEYLKDLKSIKNLNFLLCKDCCSNEVASYEVYFSTQGYNKNLQIFKDVKICFINAAHIPGSASVILNINGKKLLFSGDLGSGYSRFNGTFDIPGKVDCAFVECTYGQKEYNDDYETFRQDVKKALEDNKIVWIPSLSFNRSQKILYELKLMQDEKIIPKTIPIYSISPSANEITREYEKELSNKEGVWFLKDVYAKGTLMPEGAKLQPTRGYEKQMIIISASGDMDYGMSEGVIYKLVPNKNVFIAIVNYVSPQSNAGLLLSKKETKDGTKLLGKIKKYDIFSDHLGFEMLKKWLINQDESTSIYLIHSEEETVADVEKLFEKNGLPKVHKIINGNKVNVF